VVLISQFTISPRQTRQNTAGVVFATGVVLPIFRKKQPNCNPINYVKTRKLCRHCALKTETNHFTFVVQKRGVHKGACQ
jgi:hypothetical protein